MTKGSTSVSIGFLLVIVAVAVFNPIVRHDVDGSSETEGIVMSSGPVVASGVGGGNQVTAVVKLPTGELVSVRTMNSIPVPVGARVRLSKHAMSFGAPTYSFVGAVKK